MTDNPDGPKLGCYDCGRPYGDEFGFPDLLIPNHVWNRISPTGDDGGLLCPSCICARLYKAGVKSIPGAFMSGPVRSVDESIMNVMCRIDTLMEEREPAHQPTQCAGTP